MLIMKILVMVFSDQPGQMLFIQTFLEHRNQARIILLPWQTS